MSLPNHSYSDRLKTLSILPIQVRRELKVLKLINRILLQHNIQENWSNVFNFNKTNRNANFIKINQINRINLCDKNIFDYAIKLYNSLPV